MPSPTDPALAVLRDIEHIVWLTLLLGLGLFAIWRRMSHAQEKADASSGWPEPDPDARAGLDVSHFTWFDIAILPMVLIKFSVTLRLAATWLVQWGGGVAGAAESAAVAEPAAAGWTPVVMALDFMLNVILVSLIVLAIQWNGRRDVISVFGLRRLTPRSLALWVAVGALTVTPVVLLLSNFVPDWLAPIFGEKIQEQAAVENIRKSSGDSPFQLLLIVNAVLIAPVIEEIVFRGYFYGALKRKTSALFAAVVTAAMFAAVHNNALAFLPLFVFALCLTLFYEASRSLWVPIGMHATFNAVNIVLILAGFGEGNGG